MRSVLCCACGAASVLALGHAHAAVLWNTAPNDNINGLLSQRLVSQGITWETADDFLLGDPSGIVAPFQITSIRGWMFVDSATATSSPSFSMTLYTDNGSGLPGGALAIQSGLVMSSMPSTTPGFHIVEVEAGGLPFLIAPSSRYWVKWEGIGDGLYFFATGGNGVVQGFEGVHRNNTQSGPTDWAPVSTLVGISAPTDFAIRIEGQQVPAPASAAILGGLALSGFRRRRR